jgi:hypothetical protein
MIYIRYEYLSDYYPTFRVYKIQQEHQILQYLIHENFENIIKQSGKYPKYEHFFMLDESRFSFFRFDIFQNSENKFTIQDLKKIIKEKCQETKNQNYID